MMIANAASSARSCSLALDNALTKSKAHVSIGDNVGPDSHSNVSSRSQQFADSVLGVLAITATRSA
jgi:hypothetical protein